MLSAKNAERLKVYAQSILDFVAAGSLPLAELAYTLQIGREAMDARLALLTKDRQELIQKLQAFIAGKKEEELYIGAVRKHKETLNEFNADEDLQAAIDQWIAKDKLNKLGEFWAKGLNFDWQLLYPKARPRRMSLPTYPFAEERYWFPQTKALAPGIGTAGLHPLVTCNTSSLTEQKFSTYLNGQEFFLKDHEVEQQKILPAVAYLEMARAAGKLASENTVIQLSEIVWSRPIISTGPELKIGISLFPLDDHVFYEIWVPGAEREVYSQGKLAFGDYKATPDSLDLKAIQARCQEHKNAQQCYENFARLGLNYGPSFQAIEEAYYNKQESLARLALPSEAPADPDAFVLHPSLLDSALQSIMALGFSEPGKQTLQLPFALHQIDIFGAIPQISYAYARYSPGADPEATVIKYDVDITDASGRVMVALRGLNIRALKREQPKQENVLFATTQWQEQEYQREAFSGNSLILLAAQDEALIKKMQAGLPNAEVMALQSADGPVADRVDAHFTAVFAELKQRLAARLKTPLKILVLAPDNQESYSYACLSGLLKSAYLENPNLRGKVVYFPEPTDAHVETIIKILGQELETQEQDTEIRYDIKGCKREVKNITEIHLPPEPADSLIKDGGVYWITGGAGGLGLIFAGYLAKNKDVKLILSGRSRLNEQKQALLDGLKQQGAEVLYLSVDVSNENDVNKALKTIKQKYGKLDGIIHSAGVIRDAFLIKKTQEQVKAVFAPKIAGAVNLDAATKDEKLDFFVLFSSIAGVLGNLGQSDYAAANAFLDAFAVYREGQVKASRRFGKTISLNWPLWQAGGMTVNEQSKEILYQMFGTVPLETGPGIQALMQALHGDFVQVLVAQGDMDKMREKLLTQAPEVFQENAPIVDLTTNDIEEKAQLYIKKLLSSVLKMPLQRIDAEMPLEKYGIDSVMILDLTNQLESVFGTLPKTLFFEYQTLKELTEYFLASHQHTLIKVLDINAPKQTKTEVKSQWKSADSQILKPFKYHRFAKVVSKDAAAKTDALDIAVIGVSGRYPQAKNLAEFWENIKNGRDSITEIPKERWDYRKYHDPAENKAGRTYSKWGGFIDDVDKFDPLFFNISPREAETMEPQERLFLETAWMTLEDAGYTPGPDLGGSVGVFVGVMYQEYQLFGLAAGNSASIANRVSYFCNFHGPSMAVETMCSSSLTTIHLACQSLKKGSCRLALAGGVNVSIHPHKYILLGQLNFVSSKGRCEAFGKGGDGYVPGEGVGCVLLKPLAQAQEDGDHIYAVIKATALNHGGKTNGYTVPNPNAQDEVITQAIEEAGVDPRTISYLEAHGTGTSLGDPIEITGLTKAYKRYTEDKQFCAIGSIKSNIGHTEAAAGIAGLTKILLQLREKQIVPSLHSKTLNPNIDFLDTPFVVQQELADWKRPVIEGKEYPRIAGISSFGAGGSNAHIIIQEYVDAPAMTHEAVKPQLIVLSAKNEECLKVYAQSMLDFLAQKTVALAEFAYTLQIGRKALEMRLAFCAQDQQELCRKLQAFVSEKTDEDIYIGEVKQDHESLRAFRSDEDLQEALDKWIAKGKLGKLAELWSKGLTLDWGLLYSQEKPRRMSLPNYPFTRKRYWLPDPKESIAIGAPAKLHPLVESNTSNLTEQQFSTHLRGPEFFLNDHKVNDQKVLPAVAYLEMARAAGELAGQSEVVQLRDIVWNRPIIFDQSEVKVGVSLFPQADHIFYEVWQAVASDPEREVCSQGKLILGDYAQAQPDKHDLKAMQERCKQHKDAQACYRYFAQRGLQYGTTFQAIENIYYTEQESLAKLSLPEAPEDPAAFVLHPALLDGAFQSTMALHFSGPQKQELWLPFSLGSINIFGPIPKTSYVYARYASPRNRKGSVLKYDLEIIDESGQGIVALRDLCMRMFNPAEEDSPAATPQPSRLKSPK